MNRVFQVFQIKDLSLVGTCLEDFIIRFIATEVNEIIINIWF